MVTDNTVNGDFKINKTSNSCADTGNTVNGNFDVCT